MEGLEDRVKRLEIKIDEFKLLYESIEYRINHNYEMNRSLNIYRDETKEKFVVIEKNLLDKGVNKEDFVIDKDVKTDYDNKELNESIDVIISKLKNTIKNGGDRGVLDTCFCSLDDLRVEVIDRRMYAMEKQRNK